jgi:osmotically-inducible protein OsmY
MSPKYNRFLSATYDQRPLNDTLIARRAQERLRSSSHVSVQRLTCDVHEGMLTLRGRLPSFHTKQVALNLVAEVEGVEEITDRVDVASI